MSLDNLSEIGIVNPSMRKRLNQNKADITDMLKAVLVEYVKATKAGQPTFTKNMFTDAPALGVAVGRLEMLMMICGSPISQPVLASMCKTWASGGLSEDAMSADNLIRLEAFYRQRRNG